MNTLSDTLPEPEQPQSAVQRLIARLADSRFFTASLLLHIIIVVLVGGTVIFQANQAVPDFVAGTEGIVSDSSEDTAPPETPVTEMQPSFSTPAAEVSTPAMTALITSASTGVTLNATPITETPVRGMSDNLKSAMDSASKRAGDKAGDAARQVMGKAGGTRMGMIFGKKIEAAKLGVILDVSGSGHPHLAVAIKEIEKSFADAVLVLYPGCGLVEEKGKPLHEVRKFSSITDKELAPNSINFSTPGQLIKALKVEEFEKLTKSKSVRDRLWVSWYAPDSDIGHDNLTNHAQASFDALIAKGVDTIYWFADFQDKVEADPAEKVMRELKRKKIKLHAHNFAGGKIGPEVTRMVEETGGTLNSEKPK